MPGLARPDQPPYPYFMQYATQQLLRITDYDRTFEGGLRVQTTLDEGDQQAAEKAVTTHLPSPRDPSAALVAIDPATGAIRALVGGRDFSKVKFNLAVQAHRQTGSAAKTFTLAAAMEQHISLNSIWNGPPQLTIPDPRITKSSKTIGKFVRPPYVETSPICSCSGIDHCTLPVSPL